MKAEAELNALTERIIGSAYAVANELGFGFLEKVYENALFVLLKQAGLNVKQQEPIHVRFQGFVVGEYFPDLLVVNCIIIELKSAKAIDEAHKAQCINYLKATGMKICLLINFSPEKVEIKRFRN
jgi:GxxExxY protein